MKRYLAWAIAAVVMTAVGCASIRMTSRPPPWHDGDLIFQTSKSRQSAAILAATHSALTHMGILEHSQSGWVVLEAAGPVKVTPLDAWIRRGRFGRYAVFHHDLTETQTHQILAAAHALMGRPYDLYFSFNNRAIYCSELPYLAYGKAGITIGRVQKVSDLHMDNDQAKALIGARWRSDDDCRHLDFDHCYAKIMARGLITPVAIASDRNFRQVYSNYPF